MKIRFSELFFKPYLFLYLKKHKNQLKKLDQLKQIPDTILIISSTALGDAVLSTPAIKSLKKSFPKSKIVALIHKNYISLFENFDYIDEIVPYYGRYKKFFATIKKIKKFKPKMALIFHGNGPQDIQFAIYSGCEFIFKHPNKSPLKKYLSYDFKKQKDRHILEERVDLVRKIGGKNIDTKLEIGALSNKELISKYNKYKNYIGFIVGASELYRIWPIENFIELGNKLFKNGEKIILIGSKNEMKFANSIENELIKKGQIENLCGKTSVNELKYLINNLKCIITSDTGALHLAIALNTPTISMFSPSNPKYTGPYQDFDIHKIIKKEGEFVNNKPRKKRSPEAMRLITPEDVYSKYLDLIKREKNVF